MPRNIPPCCLSFQSLLLKIQKPLFVSLCYWGLEKMALLEIAFSGTGSVPRMAAPSHGSFAAALLFEDTKSIFGIPQVKHKLTNE